jgi:hypothetical protein
MLRLAAISSVLFATGCLIGGPGSESGEEGEEEDEGEVLPTGVDVSGRVCNTKLTVTGSFVQSMAPPLNEDGSTYTGCWPIGTWTFSAALGQSDCSSQPAVLPQYQFRVDSEIDADGIKYQSNHYMTDPSVRHRVKVSQGGDGLCEGELNLFSADGKEVWILKPELYADKHLGGDGEYTLYNSDQWLGEP